MRLLLDTNVVAELMKNQGDPQVLNWLGRQVLHQLFLSATTVQEIVYGIERMSHGKRRDALVRGLADLRERRFLGRILPLDDVTACRCGELRAKAGRLGRPAGLADAEIAAVASLYSMTVATRDLGDFAVFDVPLVDPFDPKAET
jgi:predicted nucleic acid-binding protein